MYVTLYRLMIHQAEFDVYSLWYEHLGHGFCYIYSYIDYMYKIRFSIVAHSEREKNITYNRATVRCKDERNTRQHALTGRTHR